MKREQRVIAGFATGLAMVILYTWFVDWKVEMPGEISNHQRAFVVWLSVTFALIGYLMKEKDNG